MPKVTISVELDDAAVARLIAALERLAELLEDRPYDDDDTAEVFYENYED